MTATLLRGEKKWALERRDELHNFHAKEERETIITIDLRRGMKEYESGRYGNAIFEWKLLFNNHWGQHIVDALRALHTVRSRSIEG